MIAFAVSALFASLAGAATSLAVAPARALSPPPKILNLVRHRLKPGTTHTYETLEASIVKAWARANVQVFWTALQSNTDATDILYVNMADWERSRSGSTGRRTC